MAGKSQTCWTAKTSHLYLRVLELGHGGVRLDGQLGQLAAQPLYLAFDMITKEPKPHAAPPVNKGRKTRSIRSRGVGGQIGGKAVAKIAPKVAPATPEKFDTKK